MYMYIEKPVYFTIYWLCISFPSPPIQARKVEYKDKMEEEWEMFQKSIQKESDVRPQCGTEGSGEGLYMYINTRLY